jgi:peptidyl-prolyl cis-trans isomerase SurA
MVQHSLGTEQRRNRRGPSGGIRGKLGLGLAATLLGFALGGGPAAAQDKTAKRPTAVLRILAVVNDEPISAFDLNQRLNFIIRLSNLKDNIETRRGLAPRVLRALVDETLQLQEIKNFNINVTKAEIDRAYRRVEQQNRLPAGQLIPFLKSRGIAPESLARQVKAAIGWPAVIRRKFLRTVIITNEEIDKTLAQFKESMNKPSHLAAEIFLPVDDPNDEPAVRQNAERIITELQQGASFALLARQFSQSASAPSGGNIGWAQPGELPPEVEAELAKIPPNTTTRPIRTTAGYYIVLLRERRAPGATSEDASVVLRQILLPVPQKAPKSDWDSQASLARTIKDTAKGCADFSSVSRELGSTLSGNLGRVKVRELPQGIRKTVLSLPVGVASEPQRTKAGFRVIMVCDRSEQKSTLPTRARIRRILQARQLEARARRHLRDLRQAALVEFRTFR